MNAELRELATTVHPDPVTAARHRAVGHWRDETVVDDLARARAAVPGQVALIASSAHRRERARTLTYGELGERADRFAAGLHALGVRRGQVVAFQLPNWWETVALALACAHLGAVVLPLKLGMGAHELRRRLRVCGAAVCVTVDRWDGVEHAGVLAEAATGLPGLRHRVVLGDAAATAAVDFDARLRGARGPLPPPTPLSADEVALVAFTSGTTGDALGVLHSSNTMYAAISRTDGPVQDPVAVASVIGVPAGYRKIVLETVLRRRRVLISDSPDPGRWLALLAEHRATSMTAIPRLLRDLAAEQRLRPRPLTELRRLNSIAAPLTVADALLIREHLGAELVNGWGMTETGGGLGTSAADPPGWPGRSIGTPRRGVEVRLRDEPGAGPGVRRLAVRSPSVCLGTFRRDTGRPVWLPREHDGWYDTGDLVRDDGRGGLQYLGRAADRISGPGASMIPVHDVEEGLRKHAGVADVALVGYPSAEHGELPCAVVVPAADPPPSLKELRDHLTGRGMSRWQLPTRLLLAPALPRNDLGKVRKDQLRQRCTTS
ncbi:AMP-binding protein [Actinomadura sp. ATCC 31491]|uniref:AMP-binding protein n=1 Tax=Actinomadura luzonensis TaxID=2805427 RepID=A0ABT0G1E8_9ACTN|nr:AMP-binding protein [Actinomadura luzonensis]MCK2218436.1 AMP-binding protein [Actinomadura luzonensis]